MPASAGVYVRVWVLGLFINHRVILVVFHTYDTSNCGLAMLYSACRDFRSSSIRSFSFLSVAVTDRLNSPIFDIVCYLAYSIRDG